MENDDAPDCSELLDEFIGLASNIAPGDTLILKLANDRASIEMLIDGVSVFKQERVVTQSLHTPPTEAN